jgi:hypothetical protein
MFCCPSSDLAQANDLLGGLARPPAQNGKRGNARQLDTGVAADVSFARDRSERESAEDLVEDSAKDAYRRDEAHHNDRYKQGVFDRGHATVVAAHTPGEKVLQERKGAEHEVLLRRLGSLMARCSPAGRLCPSNKSTQWINALTECHRPCGQTIAPDG